MASFKYRALQQHIEQGIVAGVYQNKLPSIRALAKSQSLSVATVQKTYEELERLGIVEVVAKRGYFVKAERQQNSRGYGRQYNKVDSNALLEQDVLYSLNDKDCLPLSSTAPSSILNNQKRLAKHHKKVFSEQIYQFQIEDEVQGLAPLRQSLSQLLHRQGVCVAPEQLQMTSGRKEGLIVALMATGCFVDAVAVESPTSFYFQAVMGRVCPSIIEIPIQADYQQELALLEQARLEQGFRTYVVNPSFQDPTGRLLSETEKLMLLNWARGAEVTLIEYDRSELYLGSTKPKSLAQLAHRVEGVKVISICDFFDTISTRIYLGYLHMVNTQEQVMQAKHTLTEEPNLTSQQVVNSLIRSGDYETDLVRLRQELRANYKKTLEILNNVIPDYNSEIQVSGGPCLWLNLRGNDSQLLWQTLIEQRVAIAPGAVFGFNGQYENYFRFTFALPWNGAMALAVEKIGYAVKALASRDKAFNEKESGIE